MFKFTKVIIISFVIIIQFSLNIFSKSLLFPEAKLFYKINNLWKIKEKELSKYHAIYVFKRKILIDIKGRKIIPAIVVGVRSYNEILNPLRYAAYARYKFVLKKLKNLYSSSDKMFSIKSGILCHGEKIDEFTKLHHNLLLFTATYGRYAISIAANVPTNLFEFVKKDFFSFFKNLKLKTNLEIVEIFEKREENHIALKSRFIDFGLVKKVFKK